MLRTLLPLGRVSTLEKELPFTRNLASAIGPRLQAKGVGEL